MNEKDLIYFKCIADNKSVSKASEILYISQPSLSQTLSRIEEEIGTPLFIRRNDGMKLTLAGEKYYRTAKEILDIYNDFRSEVSYINNLQKGKLTIGTVSFMGSFLLPRILPEFLKQYPAIEIFLEEKLTNELEKMLTDAKTDFAIFHAHPLSYQKNIDYEILYRDEFVIVASIGNKIKNFATFDDDENYGTIDLKLLKDENIIVLNKGQGIRMINDFIWDEVGLNPNIILTTKNFLTGRKFAAEGIGIMLLPLQYAKMFNEGKDVDIYRIKDVENAYWLSCLAKRPNAYISKIASVFMDEIRKYYRTNEPI